MAGQDLLRVVTCGSVDDGKSTLIGALLLASGNVAPDEIADLGDPPDPALLFDGLLAEREQGITIDVATRAFDTPERRYLLADAPGHEQYTRNMATAASTADAALVLVDARKGLARQTRRHLVIAQLMGVRQFIVAITKMDLVHFEEETFERHRGDIRAFASLLGLEVVVLPVSGIRGENIVERSQEMGWFEGPSLLQALSELEAAGDQAQGSFRLPVQRVHRPGADFRGLQGRIDGGPVRVGDAVRLLPSGSKSSVAAILLGEGSLEKASSGQSITLVLADEMDCSRGEVIAAADDPPEAADQFEASIVWLDEEPMLAGRAYWLKIGTQTVTARLRKPKYRLDMRDLAQLAARRLEMNDVGVATFQTDRPIVFEPFIGSDGTINRTLGSFILIDQDSKATVAAGMIHFALRRARNVHRQPLTVDAAARAQALGQRPAVLWFTGLSGAGKSTIADLVEKELAARGHHTFLLDGDNVRLGLNKDLGFTDADRVENIRRIGEVAKLMTDAGLIVLTAFISPFRAERQMVRDMVEAGRFVEIFIDTPLSVAEKRDEKGLYKKAREGRIANFTGIDSPYEAPENPDIRIDTTDLSASDAAQLIVERLTPLFEFRAKT